MDTQSIQTRYPHVDVIYLHQLCMALGMHSNMELKYAALKLTEANEIGLHISIQIRNIQYTRTTSLHAHTCKH